MIAGLRQQLKIDGHITLTLRVRPGARKTKIVGVMADGTIKVSVHAPAEGGKANAELIRFLADQFAVSRRNIDIIAGRHDPRKTVRITRE